MGLRRLGLRLEGLRRLWGRRLARWLWLRGLRLRGRWWRGGRRHRPHRGKILFCSHIERAREQKLACGETG